MSVDRSKVLSAAQKHLAKGNYDRAIAEYRRLVDEDPADVRTWLKIGDLQTRKGAHKDASETYHRVAEHYAEQGFFLKAVAVYKQILKLQPGRLDISLRLAEMYEQLQLVSDALQTYEQAAVSYARQGDAENMLAILDRMAKLDPENIPVRIKYAEALSKAKQLERAASEFEAGARLLEEQGRIDDYLKVAERLLYHRPGDVQLAKKLARTYLSRNDAKRALSKLQVCFKKDPRDVATLELLAQAFHVLGQKAKTISVYREMVRILAEQEEHAERARILEKILELDPNDAEAKKELGAIAAPARRPVESVPPGALVGVRSEAPPPVDDDEPVFVDVDDDEPELEIGTADDDDDDLYFVDDDASDVDLVDASRPEITRSSEVPQRASVPPDVAREAQIARLLTECEVFERYGLHDKVARQLEQVIAIAPDHIEARERLKEALLQLGRTGEAAAQLRALADLLSDQSQIARIYVRQAEDLEAEAEAADDILIDEGEALVVDVEAPISSDAYQQLEEEAAAESAPTGTVDVTSVAPAPAAAFEQAALEDAGYESFEPPAAEFEEMRGRESIEELDPDDLMELDEDLLMSMSEPPPAASDSAEAVFSPPSEQPLAPASTPPTAFDRAISSVPGDIPSGQRTAEMTPVPGEMPRQSPVPEMPLAPMSPQEFEAAPVDLNVGHVEAAQERISMPPGEVEETLDEVDFFIAQGLWDAASATLEDALETHPDHPLLVDKLQEVQENRASLMAPVEGPADDDDDAFALAEKLASELGPMEVDESEGSDVIDVESVFEQFKKGVEEQVGLEDTDTHFDLGIAYKEMGLIDDAIKEFQLAMANPQRECLCHTMVGLCRLEQGNTQDAISQFKKGLYAEQKTEREELGLYFELGNAYQMLQDPQEALYYYQKVQKRDPTFRGVEERIQRLTRPSQAPAADHQPLVLDEVDQAFDDLLGDD